MELGHSPAEPRTAERRRQSRRLGVLFVSLVASAGLIVWLVRQRGLRRETDIVEMSDELRAIYERDAKLAGTPTPVAAPAPAANGDVPPLVRGPLDEKMQHLFYPSGAQPLFTFDPELNCRRQSNLDDVQNFPDYPGGKMRIRTNSLGMREDDEVLAQKPDLRVLVTGASNVDCVCENPESATNLLERWLRERDPKRTVEALNVGVPSYSFYSYLGALEHYLALQPDALVIVAYGGNDFFNNVKFHRFFNHRGAGKSGPHSYATLLKSDDRFMARLPAAEVVQAIYYLNNPEDIGFTIESTCSATAQMAALCKQHGMRFVCAYLPPPLRGQPEFMSESLRRVLEITGESESMLDVSDKIGDAWLAFLEQRGIAHVDLRPAFRASKERLYWTTDTHVNVAGQRVIADSLKPFFE